MREKRREALEPVSRNRAESDYLGLDLRGGVHFMLQVDMKGALSKALDRFSTDIRGSLRERKIPYSGLDKQGAQVVVKFRDAESRKRAEAEISKVYEDLSLREQNVGENWKEGSGPPYIHCPARIEAYPWP